jgi:hypothetical protein
MQAKINPHKARAPKNNKRVLFIACSGRAMLL